MARIAVAGFQHETNTFAPLPASYRDFEQADGWPALQRGKDMFEALAGINLPAAGFIAAARRRGHDILPLLWCSATPSGPVTEDAFERIAGEILEHLSAARPVDALYLDLHGAMVAAHLPDGEGELLTRLRRLAGPDLPILASLDFHANVSPAMVEQAAALIAYRTYPHIDMAVTGERAAALLDRILRSGPLAKAMRRPSFLIPLTWQCTMVDPAASLFRELASCERGEVASLSFAPGFPPADVPACGPSVLAYAESQRAADQAADHLAAAVAEAEPDFAGRIYAPDAAVREAMRIAATARRPVVLADTQDNPGAGGNSDTVGLIEALLRQKAEGAVAGLLYDPATAAAAHAAGEGAEIELAIGEMSRLPGHRPLAGRFRVEKLGDGRFEATGPFYAGNHMRLGPMARLAIDGLSILVSSRKQQAADQAMFRHLGIEPAAMRILALKSSVHFRADFQPIAEAVLVVAADGPNPVDHRKLAYRHLRPGLRLMPMGPAFGG
ncbi:MAG TPA: M81 family metallopeptidase [Dongiaceae bacterium]|jgi:microcystin degradation protein MlrC|nr:M81 family metallopeptidase [Dongiaceae bacterium]